MAAEAREIANWPAQRSGFGSSGRPRGSLEIVKIQGYRHSRTLAWRGHGNSPEYREPTTPSNSEFPSLCCVSPSSRPQLTKRGGNRRGLGGARPSSCSDWLMQLSILNLFLMEGGYYPLCPRSRLPPTAKHSCPSPRARGDWGRASLASQAQSGPHRPEAEYPAPQATSPRGIGAAASQEGRSEM